MPASRRTSISENGEPYADATCARCDDACPITGSVSYYRHPLVEGIMFTEGVKYVADAAWAYWLLDEIALANRFEQAVRAEEFQVWDLIVAEDCSARLICGDGVEAEIYTKRIEWTDFPIPGIRFYICYGCIHLPSEY